MITVEGVGEWEGRYPGGVMPSPDSSSEAAARPASLPPVLIPAPLEAAC
jgi:hypothetical protein